MPEADKTDIFHLDAHHRLYIALAISVIVYFIFRSLIPVSENVLLVWICFAMSLIISQWIIILTSHPLEVRKIARLQDSSRAIIFLFVIVASIVSLGAIIVLLKSPRQVSERQVTEHILLSMGSIILSWWLVHTVFTMRYAHLYYDTDTDEGGTRKAGGLIFPGDAEPDYMDFVYFSFVLGMTFQVSDVNISSPQIRRLAWMHGLISFAYNTAIVALGINIISGLVAH